MAVVYYKLMITCPVNYWFGTPQTGASGDPCASRFAVTRSVNKYLNDLFIST